MAATPQSCSIFICTRDRAATLEQTLGEVRRMVMPPDVMVEWIIIDNGSSDATAEVAKRFLDGLSASSQGRGRRIFVQAPGKTNAYNLALREAKGEIFAFLDDDTRPGEQWLNGHLAAYTNPQISAVQGRIKLVFDIEPPAWLGTVQRGLLAERDYGDQAIFPFTQHLVGANMSFRREVFDRIGPFNVMLGPGRAGFWDDSEFSIRLMKAGCQQYYEPAAMVGHVIAARRLEAAYFRDAAFRLGASSFIAGEFGAYQQPAWPYFTFLRDSLRQVKRRLAAKIHSTATVSSESDLLYRMSAGYMWARLQGIHRLRARYGHDGNGSGQVLQTLIEDPEDPRANIRGAHDVRIEGTGL